MEQGFTQFVGSRNFLISVEDESRDFFLFCDDKKRDLPRYKLDWKKKPQLKTSLDKMLDNNNSEVQLTTRRHKLLLDFQVSLSEHNLIV